MDFTAKSNRGSQGIKHYTAKFKNMQINIMIFIINKNWKFYGTFTHYLFSFNVYYGFIHTRH